ncbi:MAG: YHS domain-containing (seleno)protein [Gammaproteobacteria bacterium]|nr:YHS domain-containing (seleno)protein [Gammaproteobacteria bacterium]
MKSLLLSLSLSCLLTSSVLAAGAVVTSPAIRGYDVIAYFTESRAVRGSPEHRVEWRGASWLFASAANKARFEADPSAYAPQYGGWCAYGMFKGYAAETDPVNAWTIHDGKLYLNWDADVARKWRGDIPRHVSRADENWPQVEAALEQGEAVVHWK